MFKIHFSDTRWNTHMKKDSWYQYIISKFNFNIANWNWKIPLNIPFCESSLYIVCTNIVYYESNPFIKSIGLGKPQKNCVLKKKRTLFFILLPYENKNYSSLNDLSNKAKSRQILSVDILMGCYNDFPPPQK